MEKKRLSAGLQSFLAWHNLCLVMTVYSLLTLTESLARINCVHDFSPCVLTLRNRRKLQHLLWSNSIFSSGSRGSVPAWNPYPALTKYQSDQRDYQINATLRKVCLHANNSSGMSFNCSQGTMDSLQRVAGQLPATFSSPEVHFLIFLTTAYRQCTSTDESQMWWPPSNYSANDRLRCMAAAAAAGVIVLLSWWWPPSDIFFLTFTLC